MSKTFFQDMIKMKSDLRKEMPGRKIDADVKLKPAPKVEKKAPVVVEKVSSDQSWPRVESRVSRKIDLTLVEDKKRPRYSLWIVAGAALVFLFFAFSYLFSKATITINPKVKEVALNDNFSAGTDHSQYDLFLSKLDSPISDEEDRNVRGGQLQNVSVAARGTVVIFNSFSSAVQKLDINTRLEGSNGKIYKTIIATTVPGMKGTTPGSIEVGIYASVPGEAYNSGPLDFKIFGFKGTAKYDKFYARTKSGTTISGGLVGKVNVLSDADKTAVLADMKSTLKAKLFQKASGLIPDGSVLLNDAYVFNVDSQNFDFAHAQDGLIPVSMHGSLSAFIFNKQELTKKIVTAAIPDYDGSDVYIANLSDLSFTLTTKDVTTMNISSINSIGFILSGKAKVVWKFDADKLISDLVGRKKSEFSKILTGYPNIDSADVTLRPLWKLSFPSNSKQISVTVNYPK